MNYTTKKELALAYCPDIDYTAALKKLNQWIRTNTELSARLAATGYIATQRRFTPQQVKLLFHYLGEPFKLTEAVHLLTPSINVKNPFFTFYILHFTELSVFMSLYRYSRKVLYRIIII